MIAAKISTSETKLNTLSSCLSLWSARINARSFGDNEKTQSEIYVIATIKVKINAMNMKKSAENSFKSEYKYEIISITAPHAAETSTLSALADGITRQAAAAKSRATRHIHADICADWRIDIILSAAFRMSSAAETAPKANAAVISIRLKVKAGEKPAILRKLILSISSPHIK